MNALLRPFREDTIGPNHLPEASWLRDYVERGAPAGAPIMLSLGESWSDTPAALIDGLRSTPLDMHGYEISMYGLPALRRALRDYISDDQGLPDDGRWELAVSWTGTRSAMRDFADSVERGTALVVTPAWDYAGFLEPLGFTVAPVPVDLAVGSEPDPESIRGLAPADLTLVVVNAQHNPTGANWSSTLVRTMVELAIERGAALLIDDAYFGVCPPEEDPTSAVRILLESTRGRPAPRWMAVRSLGKQFHCNGWALGAVVSDPSTLDTFVTEIRPRHTFNHAAHLQHAMARWLADRSAVERYLAGERAAIARRRASTLKRLHPATRRASIAGPAAPYLLAPVAGDVTDHLRRCAVECGVLLSDAVARARLDAPTNSRHVRIYLGVEDARLAAAFDRLEAHGLLPAGGTRRPDACR
jgi:aspartate/methionine/tyrosine aminotransferase